MSDPKEVAPRKERKAFRTILLAAIAIAIVAILVSQHVLKTHHEPVAVNAQNHQG